MLTSVRPKVPEGEKRAYFRRLLLIGLSAVLFYHPREEQPNYTQSGAATCGELLLEFFPGVLQAMQASSMGNL